MHEPIREYFRVELTPDEAIAFGHQVVDAATSQVGTESLVKPDRAVIFQSMLSPGDHEVAYVSLGAVELLRRMGLRPRIDSSTTPISELPAGLALVIGDAADVAEYKRAQGL
jgi:hypothetical protein